jgi:hypothetical protein
MSPPAASLVHHAALVPPTGTRQHLGGSMTAHASAFAWRKALHWAGFAAVVGGAALIGCSGRLSHAGIDRAADLLAGTHLQVDWYVLIGIMVALGGGLLAQCTRETQHE